MFKKSHTHIGQNKVKQFMHSNSLFNETKASTGTLESQHLPAGNKLGSIQGSTLSINTETESNVKKFTATLIANKRSVTSRVESPLIKQVTLEYPSGCSGGNEVLLKSSLLLNKNRQQTNLYNPHVYQTAGVSQRATTRRQISLNKKNLITPTDFKKSCRSPTDKTFEGKREDKRFSLVLKQNHLNQLFY